MRIRYIYGSLYLIAMFVNMIGHYEISLYFLLLCTVFCVIDLFVDDWWW
jgi:hypothetical protein